MKRRLFQCLCVFVLASGWLRADMPADKPTVIVCVGAPGEEQYGKEFEKWAKNWQIASEKGGAKFISIGLSPADATDDRERLKQALASEPKDVASELWLVFIGHGTFDGQTAKFNFRGPDMSAEELSEWLLPFHRPLAIINTASASGPFLSKLSKSGRVVVAATKSGFEQNYAHFGEYFSEAILGTEADLDKDGQTSLLEAYLWASRKTVEFYEKDGRLATEHALLDDNGDGLGTPADWFKGVRAVKRAADGALPDGLRAHQFHLVPNEREQKLSPVVRAQRNELELAIASLRDTKAKMPEDEYYQKLEKLMLELARLYSVTNSAAK